MFASTRDLNLTTKTCRSLAPVASVRYINLTPSPGSRVVSTIDVNISESSLEADSHADTCCLGKFALIIYDYNRPVTVYGYDPAQGSKTFRTVSGVLGYTHPQTGKVYHLVIHQAIEIPHLEHNLLCPMQCRINDVVVNETPKFLCRSPTVEDHAVIVPDPESESSHDTVVLPFSLKGVTSYLPVHRPTQDEWASAQVPRIDLTSEHLEWDPASTRYSEQEEAMTGYDGDVVRSEPGRPALVINSLTTHHVRPLADISNNDNLGAVLESKVQVASVSSSCDVAHVVSKQGKAVDASTLAKRWMIPQDRAKNTIKKTTQRGVRTVLNRAMTRRYPTNDRMLRYPRLPHTLFTDTLIAGTVSTRGNKYAQIYASNFGWARAFPMAKKGDAHETLSLLFKRDGVPPEMIMDGSKEQTLGTFSKKLKEAGCHKHQVEPYSPWQNAAETGIRELKRGSTRKMISAGSPKVLWDHCLELESRVRSCTAHDLYMLDGEVPETVMKGHTADISQICEFAWYEWVMFIDSPAQYPENREELGRYLGPAVDVGTALTAKILKANGEVVPRSTLRALSPEELANPVHQERRAQFDKSIVDALGRPSVPGDFPSENLMPELEYYEDDVDVMPDAPDEELEPTPEAGDRYVNADLLLPRGDTLARGRVIGRKRDADGNTVGRAHDNPILDTRQYLVEFNDGEVTELTANVIAQSMYAMCDTDGEHVLLFDSIVDYVKGEAALSLADQKFVDSRGRTQYRRTTKGWKLCIQWKDGSTTWEKLADMKECYPVQTAEYAVAQGIDHEPAFNY